MKQNIHPTYGPVVFRDQSAGFAFLTRSTLAGETDRRRARRGHRGPRREVPPSVRSRLRCHGRGCAMKVRASLRSLKDKSGAKVVRRRGKTYVINKQNPRWKARQG